MLQQRKVELDFTRAKICWAEDEPEYCHLLNGISSMLHYLEPYLIKVVRRARKELPAGQYPQLAQDVTMFCAQEGWHSKLHTQFNAKLVDSGYPWMSAEADKMRDDFAGFLANRSLKFCLAYAEGFETFGPIVSQFFFEEAGELMAEWDEPTVYLWLWHFAEEYEHRTVCNYLYKAVYDDYVMRVYGLWYAAIHLFGYSVRVANSMIRADLATGRIRGPRWASRLRFARVLQRLFGYILPKLVFRCMRTNYDPATIPAPRNSLEFLRRVSDRYEVRKPPPG